MARRSWKIRWTDRADRDLGRAILYLQERNPRATSRWTRDLLLRTAMLERHPEIGAPVLIAGESTPYRRLAFRHHCVYYRVDAEQGVVRVLRVWPSSRDAGDLVLE